jgi:hypothetical protein
MTDEALFNGLGFNDSVISLTLTLTKHGDVFGAYSRTTVIDDGQILEDEERDYEWHEHKRVVRTLLEQAVECLDKMDKGLIPDEN